MPRRPPLEGAFGEVLRQTRLDKGLSQEELADACGRHRTYVSLLERGRSSPSIKTLFLLAEALGVRPSQLVKQVEARLGD